MSIKPALSLTFAPVVTIELVVDVIPQSSVTSCLAF